MCRPAIVFPLHDPSGVVFQHLGETAPILKTHFATAYLSATPIMLEKYPRQVESLAQDDFFQLFFTPKDARIGTQFKFLYQQAASRSKPDQILHLCYPDRLFCALQAEFRDPFLADTTQVKPAQTPMIFQRSPKAWETHPRNYFEIEGFVTTTSLRLFGKTIDFAWCHLALQAAQLKGILPQVHREDLSMVAEMILPIIDSVQSQDVDWLAWEDPFMTASNAAMLKKERENSVAETQKRLSYVLPMLQLLDEYAAKK